MRALLTLPLLALAACAADGSFKNPLDMNAAEKCYNAKLGLAVAEANEVGDDVLARIKANVDLLCPAVPA